MTWYNELNEIYNSLKPYLLYESNTKLQTEAIFYVNIEMEMLSFKSKQNIHR